MQVKKLIRYCKRILLDIEITSEYAIIEDKKYYIINDDRLLFDEDMEFNGHVGVDESGLFGYIYEFGGRWYTYEIGTEASLNELKYIGNVIQKLPIKSFLGIRSGYELMNGIGLYEDWIKKAKFLGIKTLGICEKNTLSGVVDFQKQCLSNDIKSIIGMTITVQENDDRYEVKLYAKDFKGWLNLLKFNSIINVDLENHITKDFLRENREGLYVIADPKTMDYKYIDILFDFYMLDTVVFINEDTDRDYINNLEEYLSSSVKPISIIDAFYLEKNDYKTREVLWNIGKTFDNKTNNQYFKNKDQYAAELITLFESGDLSWIKLFKESTKNEAKVVENCNFSYDLNSRHLPKYVMTKEETSQFESNNALFLHIIKLGFKEKNFSQPQKYIDRLKFEIKILQDGNVLDYFLTTWDIMKYAKDQNMITGIARGSAGGCLVAYLLDIIKVDPLEHGLIFERFLNPGRMEVSLPDIDSDFASIDRPVIKAYIEKRFGEKQVCSVGTFSTMKIKGLVKDLARLVAVDFSESNLITSIIDDQDATLFDLMKRAQVEPKLKAFIKKNSDLFYMLPTLLGQNKTESIHPCAMIIFPKEMEAVSWAPMRMQKGLLTSQWGGYVMDDAGFLKQDILGIKQLDKFTDILALIKANGKEVPDIYNLPSDRDVFRYFGNGWNGDVFQFGSAGLSSYMKSMKPKSIDHLTAANALYRPGPMENHYHEIYVKCKNEGRSPEYLWGTKDITKDTHGLVVYQEQVMQVFQEIGNLSMKNADDIRRAMGKKQKEPLMKWKDIALKGFLSHGATEEEYNKVWDALLEFTRYSFNKSHSTAYAMTGYICQYLKVKFPIEYWTVALDYADDNKALQYLSEILQVKDINVRPPDINASGINMISDQESKTIFWGMESIKGIGEDTAMQIINERKRNGDYKSFADFYFRHTFKLSKVKKTTYEALIGCGAFDKLYGFEGKEERRMLLIKRYRTYARKKISNPLRDAYTIGQVHENWWWHLQQKVLTGLAFIDYKQIAEENEIDNRFLSMSEFTTNQMGGIQRAFGGYIIECKIRRARNGKYAVLTVEHNYKIFRLILWASEFETYEEELKGCEKHLIIFEGEFKFEGKWSKGNQFTIKEHCKLKVLK